MVVSLHWVVGVRWESYWTRWIGGSTLCGCQRLVLPASATEGDGREGPWYLGFPCCGRRVESGFDRGFITGQSPAATAFSSGFPARGPLRRCWKWCRFDAQDAGLARIQPGQLRGVREGTGGAIPASWPLPRACRFGQSCLKRRAEREVSCRLVVSPCPSGAGGYRGWRSVNLDGYRLLGWW